MTDKTETLQSPQAISEETSRLCSWIASLDPDRPLVIFWTSYSRPSIGGAQKRTGTMADKLSNFANAGFVHIRDDCGNGPGYPSFCFGSNGISTEAPLAIGTAVRNAAVKHASIYVDHVNYFDYPAQLANIGKLSADVDQIFFRMASERTARLAQMHAELIKKANVKLHCLNTDAYELLTDARLTTDKIEQYASPQDHRMFNQNGPLVCVGRIVEEKNILSLIRAWKAIPPEQKGQSQLELWGPIVDDYGRGILTAIEHLGSPSIRYCGVFTGQNNNPLARAKALVHPSLTEGASNVVIEAMARGKPVVGSSIEGVGSMLPITDFLIKEPFGEVEIRSALEKFFAESANTQKYRTMCRLHLEHQKRHYSNDIEFEKIRARLVPEGPMTRS